MAASETTDGVRYRRCLVNATAAFLTLLTACGVGGPSPSTTSASLSYEPTLARLAVQTATTVPPSSTTVPPTTSTTVAVPATTVPPTTTTQAPVVFFDAVERWRPAVTEAVFAFGGDEADVHRFLRIMQCESSGRPNAVNPTSSASGLMQHLPRYWPDRAARAGRPGADVFDPYDNIWVSAWLALGPAGGHGRGWHHWVCK